MQDSLLDLIEVDGRIVGNHLLVKLTMPLANNAIYDVKRSHPIPIKTMGLGRIQLLKESCRATGGSNGSHICVVLSS